MFHQEDRENQRVQFGKAFGPDRELIDICDIADGKVSKSQEFTCVGCGKKLRPRTGTKRIAHFYHHNSDSCSLETYLHKLGKELFRREFESRKKLGKPFILKLNEHVICNKHSKFGIQCDFTESESTEIDLVKRYVAIHTEKRVGEFIPDLLIQNEFPTDLIFVEIVVSNAPSEEKVGAGFPIIKITASSEADFAFLSKGVISDSVFNIELLNFPVNERTIDSCTGVTCKLDLSKQFYLDCLEWIRTSFEHCQSSGSPFYLQYLSEFQCNRHIEDYGTKCIYQEQRSVDLIAHFDKMILIPESIYSYILLVHKTDNTRDIIICQEVVGDMHKWAGSFIFLKRSTEVRMDFTRYLTKISDSDNLFNLTGLKNKSGRIKDCGGTCKEEHEIFCIKQDCGAVIINMTLSDERLTNGSYQHPGILSKEDRDVEKEYRFYSLVEDYLKNGIAVKNCYVCRYHGLNNESNDFGTKEPIFCKTYKKSCRSNDATTCDRYKPDIDSCRVNYIGRRRYSRNFNR